MGVESLLPADKVQVKITDFAIARALQRGVQMTVSVGTPAYVSPEALSSENITAQSDVFRYVESCSGAYISVPALFLRVMNVALLFRHVVFHTINCAHYHAIPHLVSECCCGRCGTENCRGRN